MSDDLLKHDYTVEEIKVSDLLVDPRVQRDALQVKKVDVIVRDFNPNALGVIHVSRRADRGEYIIDGWHRKEAVQRITDGAGSVVCHVYTGLTIAEEALMFLALNFKTNVTPLEKHKVRVSADDEQALRIEANVSKYGWKISPTPGNGNVNAIQKLYALDNLSQKLGMDPDLISLTFLTINRAWGTEKHAAQAVILEGVGRLWAEHGDRINFDHLIQRLRQYRGGPTTLHAEAAQYASLTKGRVAMAVAHLITEWYNHGKGNRKSALPAWRKRV
jgi:uncharacterized protein DUF6551